MKLGLLSLLSVFCFLPCSVFPQALDPTQTQREFSIPIVVSVKKNRSVPRLSEKDIEVSNKDKPLKVLSVTQSSEPFIVGFLIDMSGSSYGESKKKPVSAEMQFALLQLADFIDRGNSKNEYFFTIVNDDQVGISVTLKDHEIAKSRVKEIGETAPRGNTRFYEALGASIMRATAEPIGKKLVIVISDGVDNSSKDIDYDDVKQMARKENVLLYGFNIIGQRDFSSSLGNRGELEIRNLCEIGGGIDFRVKDDGKAVAWGKVLADELANQFYANIQVDATPGKPKWRELKVRLTKEAGKNFGDVTLRARKGIFF